MRLARLSILIPVFNEARTLRELLAQVDVAPVAGLEKELIIVDDGSTDGTREILGRLNGLQTPYGRAHTEGKKLTWRDGFAALWTLVKYRIMD